MLSSTDDFPELWRQQKTESAGERLGGQIWARIWKASGGAYLASDDGDGGERVPEGAPAAAAAPVVAEHGAGLLDPVHQPDQAPHRRHLGRARAPAAACEVRAVVAGGGRE
jgi:hypothetical protein